MPLWMLSGALFPIQNAPGWLFAVMSVNPVAHALVLIRGPFYMTPSQLFADSHWLIGLAVTLLWTGGCLAVSMMRVEKREKGAAITA